MLTLKIHLGKLITWFLFKVTYFENGPVLSEYYYFLYNISKWKKPSSVIITNEPYVKKGEKFPTVRFEPEYKLKRKTKPGIFKAIFTDPFHRKLKKNWLKSKIEWLWWKDFFKLERYVKSKFCNISVFHALKVALPVGLVALIICRRKVFYVRQKKLIIK